MIKKHIFVFILCPLIAFAQPGTESAVLTINSTLAYQGFGENTAHNGTAEYKIFYDNIFAVCSKVYGTKQHTSRNTTLYII